MIKNNFNSELILTELMGEFYAMEVDEGGMGKFLPFNQVVESLQLEWESFPDEFFTLAMEDEAIGCIF